MTLITPEWDAPSNVKAISTTRLGGFSSGVYESLNLGLHVGDEPAAVHQNRRELQVKLGINSEFTWLNQVHGSRIIDVDNDPFDCHSSRKADGSTTSEADKVCAIMTADCLPLLLTNTAGSRVAAVHAGWRGLANGVVDNALAAFDCPPDQIIAWSGPCISSGAFEVGAEVPDQLGGPSSAYRPSINAGKTMVDLVAIMGHQLLTHGVTNYSYANACTHRDSDLFFSYRRDGQCGRMASLIWIEKSS